MLQAGIITLQGRTGGSRQPQVCPRLPTEIGAIVTAVDAAVGLRLPTESSNPVLFMVVDLDERLRQPNDIGRCAGTTEHIAHVPDENTALEVVLVSTTSNLKISLRVERSLSHAIRGHAVRQHIVLVVPIFLRNCAIDSPTGGIQCPFRWAGSAIQRHDRREPLLNCLDVGTFWVTTQIFLVFLLGLRQLTLSFTRQTEKFLRLRSRSVFRVFEQLGIQPDGRIVVPLLHCSASIRQQFVHLLRRGGQIPCRSSRRLGRRHV